MVDIIVQLLKYMGLALIIGGTFGCAVAALAVCMRSGQISRDEEAGAPEGASPFFNRHFQCPDASGSKLSVRVSTSVQSSGGAD